MTAARAAAIEPAALAEEIVACIQDSHICLASDVPCNLLSGLSERLRPVSTIRWCTAVQEGDAIAVAAGGWLGGGNSMVLMQNSGLGNAVNPLTSLVIPFGIPLLLVCSWRGEPGLPDEKHHHAMGSMTAMLLQLMGIDTLAIGEDTADRAELRRFIVGGTGPRCLLVSRGALPPLPVASTPEQCGRGDGAPVVPAAPGGRRRRGHVSRSAAVGAVRSAIAEGVPIVSTTGYTSRELCALEDRDEHFYMAGSMGCALALGLGVTLSSPRPVVVLDGDGAALMRLGTLATVGSEAPRGLIHVLLDNGMHESTGGQPTVSGAIDFVAVAAACGYQSARSAHSTAELAALLDDAQRQPGPHFVHVPTRPEGAVPKRVGVSPEENAQRFRRFCKSDDGHGRVIGSSS
jgi:phosphonopyruvate decarboxylase